MDQALDGIARRIENLRRHIHSDVFATALIRINSARESQLAHAVLVQDEIVSALKVARAFVEAERDQRGGEDKIYPIKARDTLAVIDAALALAEDR